MSDICKIDVSTLKLYETKFKNELNDFNSKAYTTFSSSYLKSCSDAYVCRMSNQLQALYDEIKNGYDSIDNWFTSYITNVEGLENYLSDNGSIGAISEPNIRNSANQLPSLKKYNIKFAGIIEGAMVGALSTAAFANNAVSSTTDSFSSTYSDYNIPKMNTDEIDNDGNVIDKITGAILSISEDITNGTKKIESNIENIFVSTGAKISSVGKKITSKLSETIEDVGNFLDDANVYVAEKAKSIWNKTTELFKNTTQKIGNAFNEIGATVSNNAKSIVNNGWLSDAKKWWDENALPKVKEASKVLWNVAKTTAATIGVSTASIFEGVLQFAEAIVDFAAITGTAALSIETVKVDAAQAIYGIITGNEWSSLTKKMWNETKGFVANKYVSSVYDSYYQNTIPGKWLKENALGFDIVRKVGSGLGYTAGIVLLTIVTFGAGSVAAAGGTVTATSAAAATTTTQMAVTATAAGIGRETQDAWADGADTVEGLVSGTLGGLFEGAQFYIGGKISGLKLFGPDGIIKSIGSKEIGTKIVNGLARVILDGFDGGIEEIVKPFIKSIYKDSYYDENGNYVEFSDDDSMIDRYSEIFDDNGGWTSVLTQTVTGAGFSLLGELFDLRKYFKNDDKIKVDDADVAATLESKPEVTIDAQEKIDALNAFKDEMLKGNKSDQQLVDFMYKTFNDAIDDGNIDALNVLREFTELKKNNPDLRLIFTNSPRSYWSAWESAIVINKTYAEIGSSGVLCHELGHCLYDSVLDGELPYNWNIISERAKIISSANDEMSKAGDYIYSVWNESYEAAKQRFDQTLQESYGLTLNEYERELTTHYSQLLNNSSKADLELSLQIAGYSRDDIIQILNVDYSAKELAEMEIRKSVKPIAEQIHQTQYQDYSAISDIISAVYEGQERDLNGNKLKVVYQHPAEYYKKRDLNAPFHEIIANFTQLKISGNESSLSIIKNIFGEDFYDVLEDVFSKFSYIIEKKR